MNNQNAAYLQVIWCRKCLLQNKVFPLDKALQAFRLFARKPESQIVLRTGGYEPSFTSRSLEEPFDLWIYGSQADRENKFVEWLQYQLGLEVKA